MAGNVVDCIFVDRDDSFIANLMNSRLVFQRRQLFFFCFSKQNYTASEIISVDRSDVVRLERRRISYENKSCKNENPSHDETVGLKFLRTHDTCQKKIKAKKIELW